MKTVPSSPLSLVGLDRELFTMPWTIAHKLYQWEPKQAKNAKQKNNIYYWLFIKLLLKGFSYPVREQSESEHTSETRHRESSNLTNKYCIQVASCGSPTPSFGFLSQNIRYACLNSALGSAKPYLLAHLFIPGQSCYHGARDKVTSPCVCL